MDETLSTLNYAQAAMGIQNKPVATSFMKIGGFNPNSNLVPNPNSYLNPQS